MDIVGYADRFSVQQGDTIRFMVSCKLPTYQAQIVRLIHGDTNPEGPGFKEQPVQTGADGTYQGKFQKLAIGSYAVVPDHPQLRLTESFTLLAWISSTTPSKSQQGLISKWSDSSGAGYGLVLDGDKGLSLWIGSTNGRVERFATGVPLRASSLHAPSWYFVAASYDAATGRVLLYQQPKTMWPQDQTAAVVEKDIGRLAIAENGMPLIMAGYCEGEESARPNIAGHYNGKIDRPAVFGRALGLQELQRLRGGAPPSELGDGLIAAWDFGRDFASDRVADTSENNLHGYTVNRPTRAMRGHNWSANYIDFNMAPQEYGAIHFHDDDLDDARWDVSFEFQVPTDLKSGVYGARLTGGDSEDYVPFFVRPADGASLAKILFLVPTNSYLAYANNHSYGRVRSLIGWVGPVTPQDKFIADTHLNSTYDVHTDGSSVFYTSRLRPIVNMRPKYNFGYPRLGKGGPWQFNGDLHLVDWLDAQEYDYDVATDEDVQREGAELFKPYRVIVTGSHPEYWSAQGLDAMETYLAGGGRLMYLGGNGFFSPVSFPPDSMHCMEQRRGEDVALGELYHSTTGEPGGYWRTRGRAEYNLIGVGHSATGFDYSLPYRRLEGSYDPRAAFIFEGIGKDEVIGNFGLKQDGAGGYEIDRADYSLGTPPHALILATCTGFTDEYQLFLDEQPFRAARGGSQNPLVRGDLVYFEGPNGGGVFSVGSIAWCGSLSHSNSSNNVSRITKNVLDRFSSDTTL